MSQTLYILLILSFIGLMPVNSLSSDGVTEIPAEDRRDIIIEAIKDIEQAGEISESKIQNVTQEIMENSEILEQSSTIFLQNVEEKIDNGTGLLRLDDEQIEEINFHAATCNVFNVRDHLRAAVGVVRYCVDLHFGQLFSYLEDKIQKAMNATTAVVEVDNIKECLANDPTNVTKCAKDTKTQIFNLLDSFKIATILKMIMNGFKSVMTSLTTCLKVTSIVNALDKAKDLVLCLADKVPTILEKLKSWKTAAPPLFGKVQEKAAKVMHDLRKLKDTVGNRIKKVVSFIKEKLNLLKSRIADGTKKMKTWVG